MQRVDDRLALPELTLRGLVLGALITVLFTAANVYLGLKVGLTFSSSIPAAVISMAVLRLFPGANILENNMVQTQASAAGTLSAVIFIVPGLVMVGHWHGFPFWETAGVCAAGGILGVVYTVPLRRAMVVQSDLTYPEGVAAAEILRVGSGERAEAAPGERAEPGLRDILAGRRDRGRVQLPLGRPQGPGGRDQRLVRARRGRVPRRHRLLAGPPRGRLPGRHRAPGSRCWSGS